MKGHYKLHTKAGKMILVFSYGNLIRYSSLQEPTVAHDGNF